jgi:anti-sigma factor RsiW
MRCENVRKYVSPYLDSELDGKTSFEIVRHLELCAECRARFETEEVVEKRISSCLRQPQAGDEELWRRAMEKALRRPRRSPVRVWAAVAAALLLGVGIWRIAASSPPADLVDLLRKDYFAAGRQASHLDVATSDPERVSRFFRERMNMSVTIPSVSQMELQGGRACSLNGVPTAFILYRCDREPVSLCVFSENQLSRFTNAPRPGSPLVDERDGIVVVVICKDGRVISAAGALPKTELLALCDAFRRSMPGPQ